MNGAPLWLGYLSALGEVVTLTGAAACAQSLQGYIPVLELNGIRFLTEMLITGKITAGNILF